MICYTTYDIISREACEKVVETIHKISQYWTHRAGGVLFTLGTPLYQCTEDLEDYQKSALKENNVLWANFSWFYKILLETLRNYLNTKVYFYHKSAIPGFHIFKFDSDQEFLGGCKHFDLAFQSLSEHNFSINNQHHLSFILPVQVTKNICGLDLWDITYEEICNHHLKNEEIEVLLQTRSQIFIPYTVGKINIIEGLYWHRIAPISFCKNGELRITLQGHCTKVNGNWLVYW